MTSTEKKRPAVPLSPIQANARPWASNASRFRSDMHMPQTIARNVDLYQRIQESFDCNTIVDASKNALHFYYLYRTGYVRLVPILLVRDGQEYLESSVRRGRSFLASILRWLGLNLAARKVLKEARMSGVAVHVRYRDLVSNPEETLQRICAAAELDYEPDMLSFHNESHHNVAGTRTRFNPRPIENSASTRKNLSYKHRVAFNLCGGRFWNRIFGA
ncbi:hypothetical protein [Spiribacter roseus]|uniref:hypothetical protein n=1 Tax=Spiribacter roseus TaxID=1855875 RepID=UPI001330636D|nr:hypothetical protein [Spiribacter roseus]